MNNFDQKRVKERHFTKSSVLEAQKVHGIAFPMHAVTPDEYIKIRTRYIDENFGVDIINNATMHAIYNMATKFDGGMMMLISKMRSIDAKAWFGFQGVMEQYEIETNDLIRLSRCYFTAWPRHSGFWFGDDRCNIIAYIDDAFEILYVERGVHAPSR